MNKKRLRILRKVRDLILKEPERFKFTKTGYIITEYRRDKKATWYVCARPGYMRLSLTGGFARDGSFKGGPEWTTNREHALIFDTHRKAARVASKCPGANIVEVLV